MDVEQVVREYIDKTVHLSLGTSRDNKPWVCEVHFAYDNELNLYFRSKPSRRHSQEIKDNPFVAGDIIKQHEMGEPVVGVYFEGTAEMLEGVTADSAAFTALQGRLGTSVEALDEATQEDGHKFYRISVDQWHVFGRFGGPSGVKYSLPWGADRL